MLQLLFAVAFSAAPLTLYVPPVRSLNPFLEAVEMFVREAAVYTLRAYPRVRLGLRRIFASLNRALRHQLMGQDMQLDPRPLDITFAEIKMFIL
ncbi:uncharacterized protein [Elaeis guineensis]|uniref:uncharacterized protein isoform X2 n=1 Tax=Elaeis guineensis var. tenera TaxID=51953 RepID=UPI003C6CC6E5